MTTTAADNNRPEWARGLETKDYTGEPFAINITRSHIEDAVAQDGEHCVAGNCILQTLEAHRAYVYRSRVYIQWDENQPVMRYVVGTKMMKKVIQILDDPERNNDDIEPGMYLLRPVPPTQRLGLDRKGKGKRKRTKNPQASHSHVLGRKVVARQTKKDDE